LKNMSASASSIPPTLLTELQSFLFTQEGWQFTLVCQLPGPQQNHQERLSSTSIDFRSSGHALESLTLHKN
jgi:hypothetical protein